MSTEHEAQSDEDPVILSPEQQALVRDALATYKKGGRRYTAAEVAERARAKVSEWLPKQSA
jgi:hypothetical protein